MKIILQKITPKLISQAREFFPSEYINQLQHKPSFHESLVGRYLLAKHLDTYPLTNTDGVPLPTSNWRYWSLSHKAGSVLIGMDNSPIWVDIEIYKRKNTDIYTLHQTYEYELLWSMNLENFYRLWTIKESIIKHIWKNLDFLSEIHLTSIISTQHSINSLPFQYKFFGTFLQEQIYGYSGMFGTKIYAFCKKVWQQWLIV